MDIGRAFTYVFDDAEWVKKVLIGGLIALAGIVIPFLPGFVLYGYALEITRRIYLAEGEQLPEWDDIGGYFVRGFFVWAGAVIWLLPLVLVISCVAVAFIGIGSASGDDAAAALTSIVAFGIFGLLALLVLVWAVVVLPIIAGRYAAELRFGAMFEFGEIFAEVRRAGAGPLLMLVLTVVVASFVANLGIIACFIGVVFTSFYSYLVMAHGVGQVYRRARGLGELTTPPAGPAF